MKKKILLIILCTTFGLWVRGQSLSPSVIAAAGAESFASNVSIEWTLGELAVNWFYMEGSMLTEGFHQPFWEIAVVPNNLFFKDHLNAVNQESSAYPNTLISEFKIDVWPNPVRSILTIQIETETNDEVFIELLDVMGRKTISRTNHSPFGRIELDLSQHPPGMYLLKFFKKDGTLIKTILNTKH